MTTQRRISESGRLAPKTDDGLYPVTIITEGDGSSGRYSAELLERQAAYWSDALSFADHPSDPSKPWLRSVNSIAGRLVGETFVGEEDGKRAIKGMWKPRAEYREFVEEFGDAIGLSIYAAADGEELEDGRIDVHEWVEDPYKSVDVVVAAGRGGKFDRAAEALHTIEASLGIPSGKTGTSSEAADNKPTEESILEIQELGAKVDTLVSAVEALTAIVTPVVESLRPADKGEVDIEAAVEAAVEAKLPRTFRHAAIEAVKNGVEIKDAIKAEQARVEELRKELAPEPAPTVLTEGFVPAGIADADFSANFGA